jgi:hypothetical protein
VLSGLIKSSKVSQPNPTGDAVRASIPFDIAKVLGWKAGDIIAWKALPDAKAAIVWKIEDSKIKPEDIPQLQTELQEENTDEPKKPQGGN